MHNEAHSTARIAASPSCTARIAIASFTGVDTHSSSHPMSSLASCNEGRITQMSDIWNIFQANFGGHTLHAVVCECWLVLRFVQLVQGWAERRKKPDRQVAGGDACKGRAQAGDL